MRETLRTLWPYLRRYRRPMALGLGALLARNIAGSAVPLVIREAVDSLTHHFSLHLALWLTAALIGLTAVKGLFQYAMRILIIGVSRDVEYDLRNDLFARLVRLSPEFYARFRTGDIMARATNDLNAVRGLTGPGIMYTADTAATAVFALVIMFSVDWRLTLFALAPAPLVSLAVVFFGRYIHERFKSVQALFSDISSRVQENIAGVRVIRAYVQEEAEKQIFEALNRSYIAENLRLARVSGLFSPLLQTLTGFSFLIVLWYGGYRLLEGQLTLGSFLMFNVFLGMLIWPMIAMGWIANMLQRGSASLARINEILNQQPAIADPPRPVRLAAPLRGEIELRGVSVHFDGRPALRGLDLRIPAGATIAIVGHTGSGKSTLAQLIPRLVDPTEGGVLVDGVDVRDFALAELRRQIGFVPQETYLFSATLADNIAFGVPQATAEQIRWAADAAGLSDDIAGFPQGLDTLVGERGLTLSGGQKQRVAIARAILRDPRILILDDALSNVDTLTEERILTALAGLMRRRTTLLISHRVSTVRSADRIYVLQGGRIAEAGTHAELVARGGLYADLYQKQKLEAELEAI